VLTLPLLVLLATPACTGSDTTSDSGTSDSGNGDADADTDADGDSDGDADGDSDSDADGDSDADTDADTGPEPNGEVYELGDPSFTATIGGSTWSTDDGLYVVLGDYSDVKADVTDGSTTQKLQVTLSGDARLAGTYDITSVRFVEQVAEGGDNFNRVGTPSGMTFTVTGFADTDQLYGYSTGSVELSDTLGAGSATLSDMQVENWVPF